MFSDHRKQRAGVAKIPSDGEELFVTKSFALVQKRSDVITSFLRRGLESRSATARGEVAGFFSRKKPVTKSFHCFFACVEAFGSESFRLDET